MTGDRHVRFCESGRGRLPPATHQTSARRHLQELRALGLVDLTGERPERWRASEWLETRWRELALPLPGARAKTAALT